MLIDGSKVKELLTAHGINVSGVLHVGAFECEELPFYHSLGIASERVFWIDALQHMVDQNIRKGVPNVYKGVVSDTDGETVTFHVTNNGMSSSMLEMGSHLRHHPHVHNVGTLALTTTTLNTFFTTHKIPYEGLDFWNLDIQGAELRALRGAQAALPFVKALYLEVNTEEVYKKCGLLPDLDSFLAEHGFQRILTEMTPFGGGYALYVRKTA